ncbi:MAG TPA: hypothetical protein VHZ03_07495 [Trebonia sp.]|nr:hypothetical protein [Trebonia sp.]
MGEDLKVTSAFARVLLVEFVDKHRQWIALEMAKDQIASIVRTFPGSHDVQVRSISFLIRRLMDEHADKFVLDGGRLLLTDQASANRAAVSDALNQLLAQTTTSASSSISDQSTAADSQGVDSKGHEERALNEFFDGYEKEIMRARLGQDVRPEHG